MKNVKFNLGYPANQIIAALKNIDSASDIQAVWNYRTEGLKIEEARERLKAIREMRRQFHTERNAMKNFMQPNAAQFFAQKAANRKAEIARRRNARNRFQKSAETALPISTATQYKYGVWNEQEQCFKVAPATVAWVRWDTDTDWDYYSNSYGRPKNTYSNRRVDFETFDHKTATTTKRTFELETFAGEFMQRALAWFCNAQPVKVEKALKPVQLNPIFRVQKHRSIGNVSIYIRGIGKTAWDYCITDGEHTFHHYNRTKLVAGLRKKIAAAAQAATEREAAENRQLTAEYTHEKYNFCYTGIRSFCELNGLNFDGTYTIRELRQAVVARRAENCARFSKELRTIGVALNCK